MRGGVHYIRKLPERINATTNFFANESLEKARRIENQLALKDFNDIKAWLEKY